MKVAEKIVLLWKDSDGFADTIADALNPNPNSPLRKLEEQIQLPLDKYGVKDVGTGGTVVHFVDENGGFQTLEKFSMDSEDNVGNESLLLIKQGAEARVFESTFVGKRCVVKERFSKKYRHPILDSKLTLKRLNAEARCMTKARKLGVCTPVLYGVDPQLHSLTLEYIEGISVKDIFLEFGANGIVEERLNDVAAQIGEAIAKLHDGGLAHGDLTTSNMIVRSGTNQLVLIDFGLSFTSTLPEDKAVDLYVLERALLSMHSSCGDVMDRILTSYRKTSKQWSATHNKLAQVRQRGRKRTMIG